MKADNITRLLNADTPFFNLSGLQGMFGVTRESARTIASRLVQKGILKRLRRDLYALSNLRCSLFALGNALYQPSVISLESALNYWGIIVQVPQTVFSVGLRSRRLTLDNTEFVYRRLTPALFRFGHVKRDGFFVADPEKAFLDTLYFRNKGLVELLPEDVQMDKLDLQRLDDYRRLFPPAVTKQLRPFQDYSYEAK